MLDVEYFARIKIFFYLWNLSIFLQVVWLFPSLSYGNAELTELETKNFSSQYIDQSTIFVLHGGVVYIGGRGRLYHLNSSDISKHLHSVTMWEESDEQRKTCMILPQGSRETCYNYIRNIQQYNETHLLISGTMALFPENMLLDIKEGTLSKAAKTSTPLCSYDPNDAVTSVRGGAAGSYPNIAGTSKILQGSMMLVKTLSNGHTIKTTQGQGKMLGANPKFTSSFSADDVSESGHVMKKLYFVYGEDADIAEGNSGFRSRIAQVCANDQGSQLYDHWTSFLKVSLLCQTNEATPFTFEVVTDSTITKEGILYATFTTRSSIVRLSAVCAFKLGDIQKTFHSNSFANPAAYCHQIPSSPSPGDCSTSESTSSKDFSKDFLTFMHKCPLMKSPVQATYPQEGAPPKSGALFAVHKLVYTKIAVKTVKDKNGDKHDVIFVGTKSGNLLKYVSILNNGVVEEVKLADYNVAKEAISDVIISSTSNHLYVHAGSLVIQMSTGNCEVYLNSCRSCDPVQACVSARDPMCGWDKRKQSCVDISTVANVSLLIQDVISGQVNSSSILQTENVEKITKITTTKKTKRPRPTTSQHIPSDGATTTVTGTPVISSTSGDKVIPIPEPRTSNDLLKSTGVVVAIVLASMLMIALVVFGVYSFVQKQQSKKISVES